MANVLIENIGELFTGDLVKPLSAARSLLAEDGRITTLSLENSIKTAAPCEVVIDARGGAVMPGLIDGHVHPVFGEWTPTQDTIGWIGNYLHGGTTTMVSAGELHVPGLDYEHLTPELVTSLAVVMAHTTGRVRWSGVKLIAGTVLLVPGMTEAHFDRLAQAGSKFAKFIFYPLDTHRDEAMRYVRWCRERGIRVKVHTGGVSRSGASVMCGYEILSWLQPDIAAHVSGGPIPMGDDDLDKVIDHTAFALEICSSGNYGSTARAVKRLAANGALARLCVGTDTPGGTGIIPRGMLRNILFMTSICGLTTADAIAVATGNTARAHGLDCGVLAPGRPADIVVCAPVQGSQGSTLSDTIAHGDLPGISHVLVDGVPMVMGRSRQTPPPQHAAKFMCCNLGWLSGKTGEGH
ncbi:MAG: adenosine deaminase [Betaproteobacteria bacterium]|nr:adenosine deaminase [Betaproteobacteria bacterium]